jgi:hypothetical protein
MASRAGKNLDKKTPEASEPLLSEATKADAADKEVRWATQRSRSIASSKSK